MNYETKEIMGYTITRKIGAMSCNDVSFIIGTGKKHLQEYKENSESYINNTILPYLKEKCVNFDEQEKRSFLKNKFGVDSFNDLKKLSTKQLRECINER